MKQSHLFILLFSFICGMFLAIEIVSSTTAVAHASSNNVIIVPFGAAWQYLDDGSDQATAWRESTFDDSTWTTGTAEHGYGDADETTIVSYGSDPNNKYITTYFRHTFTVADASTIPYLAFSILRDDGIVVYLNGTKIISNNMPIGAFDYQTLARTSISGSEETTPIQPKIATNGILVDGDNVLAVEIHQKDSTDPDISFDLQLEVGAVSEFVQYLWSGAITSDSAKVNARLLNHSSAVRLIVSENGDLTDPLTSGFVTTSSANNDVAALTITGLTPDTAYFYAIEADGILDTSKIGRFHTFADGPFSYTFAAGGDISTGSEHAIFTSILDQNPLFFLNPGDMFYTDIVTNDRDLFRTAYDLTLESSTQSALYQQVPLAYVWDDHDFSDNDSDETAPGREAARLTYQEYVPHYPLGAGSGDVPIYQAFSVGRAHFIMLDLRSERNPRGDTDNANKTMMGAAQKAWFKQQLLDANGTYPLIFIVNPVPWLSASGSDNWSSYTTERREIADFIKDNGIRGVVMISADAHMLALDDGSNNSYATGGGGSFPIFHAAALDKSGTLVGGPYSHGAFEGKGQFALITVTDSGGNQVCVAFSGLRRNSSTTVLEELIAWDTCYFVNAVSPSVIPAINGITSTTLDLAWNADLANCSFDIWSDTTPYFDPESGTLIDTITDISYPIPLAVGSVSENHFYWVKAVNCDASSTAVSNHTGEFDFAIVPGS